MNVTAIKQDTVEVHIRRVKRAALKRNRSRIVLQRRRGGKRREGERRGGKGREGERRGDDVSIER